MNNDKYNQILRILESNDTRCMDDKSDREALALSLMDIYSMSDTKDIVVNKERINHTNPSFG